MRIQFRTALVGVSLTVGLLSLPALAQEDAASEFTTETVVPGRPFEGLPIDRTRLADHIDDIAGFLARLTDEQEVELRQRCVVVTGNADLYAEMVVEFCTAVLEQPAPTAAEG